MQLFLQLSCWELSAKLLGNSTPNGCSTHHPAIWFFTVVTRQRDDRSVG